MKVITNLLKRVRNWSLPNRITLYGFLLALLMSAVSFSWWGYDKIFEYRYSEERIAERLSLLFEKGRFQELDDLLAEIKEKGNLSDLYNYYTAIQIKNGIKITSESASKYFKRVDVSSKFYRKALIKRAEYEARIKGKNKFLLMEELADDYKTINQEDAFYYYLKIFGANQLDYDKVYSLYNEFRSTYSSIIDFENSLLFSLNLKNPKSSRILLEPEVFDVGIVRLFFRAFLTISAYNSCEKEANRFYGGLFLKDMELVEKDMSFVRILLDGNFAFTTESLFDIKRKVKKTYDATHPNCN
jgi:hypothetical protein